MVVADFLIVSTRCARVTFSEPKKCFEHTSSQIPLILTMGVNSSQIDSGERHFPNLPNYNYRKLKHSQA